MTSVHSINLIQMKCLIQVYDRANLIRYSIIK